MKYLLKLSQNQNNSFWVPIYITQLLRGRFRRYAPKFEIFQGWGLLSVHANEDKFITEVNCFPNYLIKI